MRASSRVVAAGAVVALAGCSSKVVEAHPVPRGHEGASSGSGTSGSTTSNQARLSDPAEVRRIESDARADLVASNSYSYRTAAGDLFRGLAHTTGELRAQYRKAFTTVVEPDARKLDAAQHVRIDVVAMQATPARAGVSARRAADTHHAEVLGRATEFFGRPGDGRSRERVLASLGVAQRRRRGCARADRQRRTGGGSASCRHRSRRHHHLSPSAPDTPIASTLEVTAQLVGGRRLVSAVQNVGVR